jgi:hypothetical protein
VSDAGAAQESGADLRPEADLGPVTSALARLKRDREGVAMFLVLEDLATDGEPAAETGPEPDGPALAQLTAQYGRQLMDAGEPTERQVAGVLEVLAALHFNGASR